MKSAKFASKFTIMIIIAIIIGLAIIIIVSGVAGAAGSGIVSTTCKANILLLNRFPNVHGAGKIIGAIKETWINCTCYNWISRASSPITVYKGGIDNIGTCYIYASTSCHSKAES